MIRINEKDGITKDTISFSDYFINLLKEYKKNNKMGDYNFACNLLSKIFDSEKINANYGCSCKGAAVYFLPSCKVINIDTVTLERIVTKYMSKKRHQGLLLNRGDGVTNFNILFASLILHELVHLLQFDITKGEDTIYKEIYSLIFNKMGSEEYNFFDGLLYHFYHNRYLNEKSATCYSLQMVLELVEGNDLISGQSLNDLKKIYLFNLLGSYRYYKDQIVGECFDTYRLLGLKKEHMNLKVNSNIPLYIKMSNGLTLSNEAFNYFVISIDTLQPNVAKEKIMRL